MAAPVLELSALDVSKKWILAYNFLTDYRI